MLRALKTRSRNLLSTLGQLSPGSALHDYDRVAFQELRDNGLADWEPRGWAGISIFITPSGRAALANFKATGEAK
jgi:hypothetical protein